MNSQRHNSTSPHLCKKGKYSIFQEVEQTEAQRGIAGIVCFAAYAFVFWTLKDLYPFRAKPDISHK